MKKQSRSAVFGELSTPLVADAALRLKIAFRIAPPGIKPVVPGARIAGDARPVQHFGSVDVFLEAMQYSQPGNVLVIDNGGRMDEGCSGDLTTLEAQVSGLAGIVVWGAIRNAIFRRSAASAMSGVESSPKTAERDCFFTRPKNHGIGERKIRN